MWRTTIRSIQQELVGIPQHQYTRKRKDYLREATTVLDFMPCTEHTILLQTHFLLNNTHEQVGQAHLRIGVIVKTGARIVVVSWWCIVSVGGRYRSGRCRWKWTKARQTAKIRLGYIRAYRVTQMTAWAVHWSKPVASFPSTEKGWRRHLQLPLAEHLDEVMHASPTEKSIPCCARQRLKTETHDTSRVQAKFEAGE